MTSPSKESHNSIEYKDFDGCLLPSEFFTVREKIEQFEIRDSDIWITSYPKSGATWLQEVVWLLCNDMDFSVNQNSDVTQKFALIESNCLYKFKSANPQHANISKTNEDPLNKNPDIFKILDETSDPRFIKTHLPFNLLPRQIREGLKTPKIIHLLRHPSQLIPSFYKHVTETLKAFEGDEEEFLESFFAGKLVYGKYFENVFSYWHKRHLPNVLFVAQESLASDLKGATTAVARFLGLEHSEAKIGRFVLQLKFSAATRGFVLRNSVVIRDRYEDRDIIISECVGDEEEVEFPSGLRDKIDEWVSENVKGSGLPYEARGGEEADAEEASVRL